MVAKDKRYSVQSANPDGDLFFVRDAQTQRPVDKDGHMVVPATNDDPNPPRADFLFGTKAGAQRWAEVLEITQP